MEVLLMFNIRKHEGLRIALENLEFFKAKNVDGRLDSVIYELEMAISALIAEIEEGRK